MEGFTHDAWEVKITPPAPLHQSAPQPKLSQIQVLLPKKKVRARLLRPSWGSQVPVLALQLLKGQH